MIRGMSRSAGLAVCALAMPAPGQAQDAAFPKGELSHSRNHSGDIWLNELVEGSAEFDPGIAVAIYGPSARLDWHVHPGGQVLLITEGTGYYQERGQPARIVRKGDVIRSASGAEHWHGALPRSTFAYIAVTPTRQGKTIWLKPVSDAEYASAR